ncbi:DUF397 domain-containing protein [Cryptosporangium arvum]|uniref:DUF397 domain-containing protein n=1 Tax=Cryptosporangium arvum TaxID=80871 RepID=UPI000A049B3C|nr:DUF397 domain-containing protein [Cryptosporangium arvum]
MPSNNPIDNTWRKSSASGVGNCVEIRANSGTIDIRDSKNPGGNLLHVSPAVFQRWIDGLKSADLH